MDWQHNRPNTSERTYRSENPHRRTPSPETEPPPTMSWFQRTTSTPSFQFGATALVAGGLTAAALLSYQHLRREEAVYDLKSSIPELDKAHPGEQVYNMYPSFCNTSIEANAYDQSIAYELGCCISKPR